MISEACMKLIDQKWEKCSGLWVYESCSCI